MKRTLEEYKRDHPIGSKVVVVYTVVDHETDPEDPFPVEALCRGREGGVWIHHADLDGLDYDELVEAVDLDDLLAAIERKVGQPTKRRHWRELKIGDTVTMSDGTPAKVIKIEPKNYIGDQPVEFQLDSGETTWPTVGRNFWPEEIDYD